MATSFGTGPVVANKANKRVSTGVQSKGRPSQAPERVPASKGSKAKPSNGTHAREKASRAARGVVVSRMFTRPGIDPLENGAPGLNSVTGAPSELVYERRSSIITNPDGTIVFKMEGAEIPSAWSQLTTDIVISKYFRRAGLNGDAKPGAPFSSGSIPGRV